MLVEEKNELVICQEQQQNAAPPPIATTIPLPAETSPAEQHKGLRSSVM